MSEKPRPVAIVAAEAPPRAKPTNYPKDLAVQVAGREKRPLGDLFGIKNFGVNLTRLAPGAATALLHRHTRQDEMLYVLAGHPTLITDDVETPLAPGMCAGFAAGGVAHRLVNRGPAEVVILEIGDRTPGDEVTYPDDDLKVFMDAEGKWVYTRKDGSPAT